VGNKRAKRVFDAKDAPSERKHPPRESKERRGRSRARDGRILHGGASRRGVRTESGGLLQTDEHSKRARTRFLI